MLFIYSSTDAHVDSIFWLLRITLLWKFIYRFLCGCVFSLLLGIYRGTELLGQMITPRLTVWGTAKLPEFRVTFPPAMYECYTFSTSLPSIILIITMLIGVKSYLIVAFIYIPLMANDVEQNFSCAYWSFVYLLWKKMPIQILCPFFQFCYLAFYCWVVRVYILDTSHYYVYELHIFSPILWDVFSFW